MSTAPLRVVEAPPADAGEYLYIAFHGDDVTFLGEDGHTGILYDDDFAQVAGRRVVVIAPTADGYAAEKAPGLAAHALRNGAASVRIVAPPMSRLATLRTWCSKGGSLDDLDEMADAAPDWTPAPCATKHDVALLFDDEESELDGLEIVDRWPVMESAAFHGVLGRIVRKAEPHCEGDPAAMLVQSVVAAANMLGRRAFCQVSATRHYGNLFAVLVGSTSGGRKGTAWDPIEFVLRMVDPVWADNCILSGIASGEAIIERVRDERYEDKETRSRSGAVFRERVIADFGVSDKRLLIYEPEFGRFLKVGGRDGSIVTDVLREAWDRGRLASHSKNNPVKATDAHISLVGHVTVADLEKHLVNADTRNGTCNRILWCLSRRSKSLPEGGDLDAVDWSDVRRDLEAARNFVGREPEIKLTRDHAAQRIWKAVYEEHTTERPGLFGDVTARAAPQILRISGVFAVLDGSAVIRPEHIIAANAVWNFCEASAKLIFDKHNANADSENLLAELRSHPDGLTRTEISRDVFHGNKTAKDIVKLLGELLTQGVVHRDKRPSPSGKGRPAERWFFGRSQPPKTPTN